MHKENEIMVGCWVNEEVYFDFRRKCEKQKESISKVLRKLIEEFIKENDKTSRLTSITQRF